jgi:hypothetical protein
MRRQNVSDILALAIDQIVDDGHPLTTGGKLSNEL